MSSIQYIKGDATVPQATGIKIIVHICNNIGKWGKGFVLAVSRRWPEPEKAYRAWHRNRANNDFELGNAQFIQVSEYIWVGNMIGQQGVKRGSKGVPIRYEAVEAALGRVAEKALELEASVHMPRIGTGLAGGKWDRIEPLIERTLIAAGVEVYVYDFG